MAVPNELFVSLMRMDCKNAISAEPSKLTDPNAAGLFVCTYAELLELKIQMLQGSFLCLDELHKFLGQGSKAYGVLKKVAHVFALSATLGGRVGKEKL